MAKSANRWVHKRSNFREIDLLQVHRIVERTFNNKKLLSPVQANQLLGTINHALTQLYSVADRDDQLPDASTILQLLKTLKRTLTWKRLWFLEAVGREYQRHHDPLRGYMFLDDTVRDTVHELSRSVTQIARWLENDKFSDAVRASLKPALVADEFIVVALPMIFEMVFGEKCGTGRTGPGPRFIIATLKESGIRPEDDSDETIAEAIKQARARHRRRKK